MHFFGWDLGPFLFLGLYRMGGKEEKEKEKEKKNGNDLIYFSDFLWDFSFVCGWRVNG